MKIIIVIIFWAISPSPTIHSRSRVFIVFILSFKMFISSVYLSISLEHHEFATSVTGYVDVLCEGALWRPV